MAVTITNRAAVSYTANGENGSAVSNLATTTLQGPLAVTKASMESVYRAGSRLTYIVTLENTSSVQLTNVTVTDNLGTYTYTPSETAIGVEVTPLTYTGPARYYINGTFSQLLTPTVTAGSLAFTLPTLPANAKGLIVYDVTTNENAPLKTESDITNTVSATAGTVLEPVTAQNTVSADSYADVRIIKAMTPNPVIEGSTITYTFTIYNYGNTEASSLVLTDAFSPAPTAPLTVAVNGTELSADNYTYENGLFTLPAPTASELSVPAAAFTTSASGVVSTTPGSIVITVSGTI